VARGEKPDVLFFIFNDHITSFFFDHYSHFALGVGDSYHVADEGGGPRRLPPVKGHPKLATHIAAGLVADESICLSFKERGSIMDASRLCRSFGRMKRIGQARSCRFKSEYF